MYRAIPYYCTSSGESLDLESQRAVVRLFATSAHLDLDCEHFEASSATFRERSEGGTLRSALVGARKNRQVIIVARLAILIRDLAELADLISTEVRFLVADPAGPFVLYQYGLAPIRRPVERSKIEAGLAPLHRARAAQMDQADRQAARTRSIVDELRRRGITSLAGLARELNKLGVATTRGGKWHASTVRNVLMRSATLLNDHPDPQLPEG